MEGLELKRCEHLSLAIVVATYSQLKDRFWAKVVAVVSCSSSCLMNLFVGGAEVSTKLSNQFSVKCQSVTWAGAYLGQPLLDTDARPDPSSQRPFRTPSI